MRKKQLKMYEPYVKTYVHHAYPLSMLESTREFKNWIQQKFCQIYYCQNNPKDKFLNYDYYDFFTSDGIFVKAFHSIPFDSLSSKKRMLDFIIERICDGWYIYGMWNEFYIPESRAYQRTDYMHEYFLTSVDEELGMFGCLGYTKNYEWKYFYVTFEQYLNAVVSDKNRDEDGHVGLNSYQRNRDFVYSESTKASRNGIVAYLAADSLEGIHALEDFFEDIKRWGKKREYIPRQSVYLAYEHKKLMLARLKYLGEKGEIEFTPVDIDEYIEIGNGFHSILNNWIRYAMQPSSKTAVRMYDKALQLLEKEQNILSKIIFS